GADQTGESRIVTASAADHDGDGRLRSSGRTHHSAEDGAHPSGRGQRQALRGFLGEVAWIVEQARHRGLLRALGAPCGVTWSAYPIGNWISVHPCSSGDRRPEELAVRI